MKKVLGFSALALLLGVTGADAPYRRGAPYPELARPSAGGSWYYLNGSGNFGRRSSNSGTYGNGIGSFGERIGPIAPDANGG